MSEQEKRTEQHAKKAAKHLAELEPGWQPYPLFKEAARLFTGATVEMIPVQRNPNGNHKVFLTKRPPEDEFWPDQWHIPGAVLLSGGEIKHGRDYGDAIDSIMNKELGGDLRIVRGPLMLGPEHRPTPRGDEIAVIHWAEVEGQPDDGTPFDLSTVSQNPPEGGLVEGHDALIARVAQKYHVVRRPQTS
jgi:hypothetical protein